ncbi:putative repeat protein (TIGR02059 family) [Paenibacillus rhizosphaerae]|uniref:Putative repeat protein (TIGR02059 family) n=1 Tax=Paenibacillus rhizosphaerae TaxID=297318 RepID=A0A839TZQ0_9BACL|nr:Ig-like domain-containing protein [Paenibacillus rhizosphaerae]MBB3130878.1 putative repeat protein (TIGR02059 family) [Paenibacillus rhizosphaerae]
MGGGTVSAAAAAVQAQASAPLVSTLPADEAIEVGRRPDFQLTFNQNVHIADPSGDPTKDPIVRIIDLAHTDEANQIKLSLNDLKTMNSTNPALSTRFTFQLPAGKWLSYQTKYQVTIEEGVFQDDIDPLGESTFTFTTLSKLAVVDYAPQVASIGASTTDALQLSFNEEIQTGSGSVQIKRASDNQVVDTITLTQGQTNSRVQVDGKKISFTLSRSLDKNTTYYVYIPAGVITTLDGQAFGGLTTGGQWYFTTQGDTAITAKSPQSAATGIATNSKLQLTFNNPVYPGQGTIDLYKKSNGTKVTSINVQSTQVTGGGSTVVTIDPGSVLAYGTSYYVIVPTGAFQDRGGSNVTGITSTTGWTFTTAAAPGSTTPLTVTSFSPTNGSANVAVDTTLYMNFNREVVRGSGNVLLRKSSNGASVPVTVMVSGTQAKIQLQSGYTLDRDASYYVTVDSGAFYDKQNPGMNYAGITSSTGWTFQTYTSDKQAPVLQSSEMYSNTTIRLVYNEALYSDSWPSTANFNVTVNDEARRISYVYTSGDSVYVILETGVAVGQNVKISYSGGSSPIRDTAGNAAAAFGAREVVNGVDSALPKPTSGTISGSTVVLYFSQSLKSPSAYAYEQFTVTADGASMGVKSVSQSGQSLTLSLNTSVGDGQVVRVSYKPGAYPIQDSRGQNIAEFTDYIVRNYWDTKPPVLDKAEGGGTKLVLTYNELLSTTNVPMKSQFSVLVNNVPNYVTAVEIKGSQVTLTLTSTLSKDNKVTISYVPGTARLTDLNGNSAGYLNLEPVTVTTLLDMGDIQSAVVQGDTIQVVFNKTLVSQSSVTVTQFQVLVDGTTSSLASASVNGSTLTIKLSSPVISGQKVELSYIPGATPLRDSAGTYLKYFNKIPVSNTGTTTGSGSTDPNRPFYLILMEAGEFGQAMFALGNQATAVSDVKSRNNQYIKQYRVDGEKLKQAYQYMLNSGEKLHTLVVDAAVGLSSASVTFPLDTLQQVYNIDRSAVLAVKAGDAVYMVPFSKINLPDIASSLNASSSSVTLNITVEKLSAESAADLSKKLNTSSSQKITEPVDFYVSAVNNSSPNNPREMKLSGEVLVRTNSTLQDSRSSLVRFDSGASKLTYVPGVIDTAGSHRVFHAKVKGNFTVFGATFYKYYSDLGNHWAKDAISTLSAKQVIEGRTNTLFAPDQSITRAEFAEYVARALGLEGDAQSADRFYDVVNIGSSAYIGAAAKAGIVTGNTDGSFKPNSSITREQMGIMMVRAMNYAGYNSTLNYPASTYLKVFKDSKQIQYPDSAARVLKEGIIQGVTVNTYQPRGNATRAQAAVMLQRLLEKIGYL